MSVAALGFHRIGKRDVGRPRRNGIALGVLMKTIKCIPFKITGDLYSRGGLPLRLFVCTFRNMVEGCVYDYTSVIDWRNGQNTTITWNTIGNSLFSRLWGNPACWKMPSNLYGSISSGLYRGKLKLKLFFSNVLNYHIVTIILWNSQEHSRCV